MKTITNYIKRFLLLAAMAVMSATALGAGAYCDSTVTGGTMSYETTATNTYKVTYTSTYQLTGVANCNFYYRNNAGNGVVMPFSKIDEDGYVWAATFETTYTAGDLTYANYCAFYKSGGGDVAVNFPTGSIANYAGTCSSVTVTIGEKTSTYNSVTLNWSVSGGTPTAQVVKYKETGESTWLDGPSVLANATSATITGLDASTTYDLKVIATVSSVDYEDTDTKATTALPSVATSGTTVTSNSVKVDWTRSNFSAVSAQTVYYKKTSDSEYSSANVGSTSAETYTLSSLQCGTAYDIYVSVTEDETDYDSDEVEATPSNTSTQLPVTSDTRAAHGGAAEMLVYITGYGSTYPANATYYSYENTSNCAEARRITSGPTAAGPYLVFGMGTTSTGIGEYKITYTNGETTACAIVTFATGVTIDPEVTSCSSPCPDPTVTIGTATSTSSSIIVPFSHSNFTSTPTFTEQHRISPSGTWSTAATVTSPAVITGLSEGTSYDIKITGTYLEETDYDEETVATTNPTTCSGESDVKNTLDGSLANNCNFTVPYEFEITTSDLTENDPTVLVRYKYTQSQSIDNNQVKLCRMFEEGQIESELQMSAEAGGTGWWYINLEGETLGNLSVGDSAKFAIKVVPVGGCTGGSGTFYATRMFAYKVGVGCNDARAFEFTKRLASQTTFFIQTDASIQRILVNKKGSSEYIQDNHIEPAASKFALDISGYELGTYEFEIFDESGRSDDIKIIHTVY